MTWDYEPAVLAKQTIINDLHQYKKENISRYYRRYLEELVDYVYENSTTFDEALEILEAKKYPESIDEEYSHFVYDEAKRLFRLDS
jgi:hypothetical protein